MLGGVIVVTLAAMGRLEPDSGARPTERVGSLALLRNRVVTGSSILVTSQFLIGAREAVRAVSLTDLGAATWEIGLSFTLFAIPLGGVAPLGGSIAQRTGGVAPCAAGLGGTAVIATLLGFLDSVWGLVCVSIAMGVGAGLGHTAGLSLFSRTVGDDRRAAAEGILGATEVLLGGAGSVLAARLHDVSGRGAARWAMPVMSVAALLLGLVIRSRTRAQVSGSPTLTSTGA